MARRRKLSDLSFFNKVARDNGMTYAQLQVLETCEKVVVTPNGQLIWRNKRWSNKR